MKTTFEEKISKLKEIIKKIYFIFVNIKIKPVYSILLSFLILTSFFGGMLFQATSPDKIFISKCNSNIEGSPSIEVFDYRYQIGNIDFLKRNNYSYEILTLNSPTDSMRPTIVNGNHILIIIQGENSYPKENIKKGMIIGYVNPHISDYIILHRIYRIDGDTFYTKGDNVFEGDSMEIKYEDIKYIVAGVLY